MWVYKTSLGMPQIGQQYVFFLKAIDEDFDLLTAYEIRDGKVAPLDGGTPNFKVYENVSETDFLNTLHQRIATLSKSVLKAGRAHQFVGSCQNEAPVAMDLLYLLFDEYL